MPWVAGTSIEALIGSVYASGKLEDLEKVYLDFDWKKPLISSILFFPNQASLMVIKSLILYVNIFMQKLLNTYLYLSRPWPLILVQEKRSLWIVAM